MLIGYNTNVPYKGTIYHVQTEDSGIKSPVVITLLYIKGTILSSKKTSYADIASSPDYKEKVRELMKEQHKTMIKELIAGKHTPGADAPPAPINKASVPEQVTKADDPMEDPKSKTPKSLDDILLDYIIKRDK